MKNTVHHSVLEDMQGCDAKALECAEQLCKVVTNLRYEGRAMLGRNLSQAREIGAFFNSELRDHIELEEKILFPFLETNLPKLETLISLLRTEHEDFKANLQAFELALLDLAHERRAASQPGILEKVRESALYLIYLLRNHVHMEQIGIYSVMKQSLKPQEIEKLEDLISAEVKAMGRAREAV